MRQNYQNLHGTRAKWFQVPVLGWLVGPPPPLDVKTQDPKGWSLMSPYIRLYTRWCQVNEFSNNKPYDSQTQDSFFTSWSTWLLGESYQLVSVQQGADISRKNWQEEDKLVLMIVAAGFGGAAIAAVVVTITVFITCSWWYRRLQQHAFHVLVPVGERHQLNVFKLEPIWGTPYHILSIPPHSSQSITVPIPQPTLQVQTVPISVPPSQASTVPNPLPSPQAPTMPIPPPPPQGLKVPIPTPLLQAVSVSAGWKQQSQDPNNIRESFLLELKTKLADRERTRDKSSAVSVSSGGKQQPQEPNNIRESFLSELKTKLADRERTRDK